MAGRIKQKREPGYKVFFAPGLSAIPRTEPLILIEGAASRSKSRFAFKFSVYDSPATGSVTYEGRLLFGYTDADPDSGIAKVSPKAAAAPLKEDTFFTLQLSLQAYREIVRVLGVRRAVRVLNALHDLVDIKRVLIRPRWYKKVTESLRFERDYLGSYDAFFAYHNAGRILDGLDKEEFSNVTPGLDIEFLLPHFSSSHQLNLRFAFGSPLPSRIAVLIGKNGTGKSQTLGHIAASLQQGDSGVSFNGSRPQISRLLAICSPGETSRTFPPVTKQSKIYYRRIVLQSSHPGADSVPIGDIVRQLAMSRETLGTESRWNIFVRTINDVLPTRDLYWPLRTEKTPGSKKDDVIPFTSILRSRRRLIGMALDPRADLCRMAAGRKIPLSSGELTFVRFAAHACLHIENATLLLLDEPEVHLHPNLISRFVTLLDRLLRSTGSIAVIATHSAYFVREVPRAQVHILTLVGDGQVVTSSPRLKTFGADVGEISEFVFGDELIGGLAEILRKDLESNRTQAASKLESMKQELSIAAYMLLRDELGLGSSYEAHTDPGN